MSAKTQSLLNRNIFLDLRKVHMESSSSKIHDFNHCLFIAALFKNSFCIDWLIELTDQKASRVMFAMEEGTHQGWLLKHPAGFFAFKDSETQKQFQERLTLKEKYYWHRKIADFLMKEFPDDQESAEKIAHHLFHVQNDLNGCRWLLNAADNARRSSSYTAALRYYTKILGDLYSCRGPEADMIFVETAIKYARVSIAREDTEKVLSILQEAISRAQQNKLQGEVTLLKMHLARNDFLQSKYSLAIQHFEEGRAAIKNTDEYKFSLASDTFRFFFYFWQGHLKKVIQKYEESVPTIEKFPIGRHHILATGMVGFCYAQTGQFTQGLGLLNALRKHCLDKGDHYLASDIEVTIAGIMIELRRPDEALSYLLEYKAIDGGDTDWNLIRAKIALAAAYFLKGEKKEAVYYFSDWFNRSSAINVNVIMTVFYFEICKAMEEGNFPRVGNIRLEYEVQRFINDDNILMKGVACRYKAFLLEREGHSHEKIIEALTLSAQWLEESGHVFEMCRTQMELLRQHTLIGEEDAANKIKSEISNILGSFSQDFVPADLRAFIKIMPQDWESFCDEIMKLSQDISTIRDQKQLLQIIISTANRMTGAERGAVFSIERNGNKQQIRLKASKNITAAQASHQNFATARKMIEKVALTRKGMITKKNSMIIPDHHGKERILSQICVPMVIRNKVVGVLYHDNNLFINSFKEKDLKLLGYFAAQAAIALDHAKAYEEIQHLNQKLNQEKQYYKEQSVHNINFENIIGTSPEIREVLNKISQVADTDTAVLILGETGVGKELVARAIHNHGKRANQPFIKVLCNALPESLISSELFGHEKGAFTGSVKRQIGRFELADGGSIFLDEIGDLQLDIQTRLLQVLQSKEFERVGGSETIRSDFRLITATNRDLTDAVKNKRFRSDLYYRLNVFPIYVPPLRDRKPDIPLLSIYFLKNISARLGKTFDGIPKKEMEKLIKYNWPGNIRELEGIIERATVLSQNNNFRLPDLSIDQSEINHPKADLTLEENERLHILHTLRKTGWKVRGDGGAAELLNINYSTLFFRMRKLGIKRPPELSKTQKKSGV